MKEFYTIDGFPVLVDAEDYERVMQYSWRIAALGHGLYVVRWDGEKHVHLSRFILGLEESLKEWQECVDHVNQQTLDNRKENLRITDRRGNALNSRIRSDNTSGVKGVSYVKRCKKWRAYGVEFGRQIHLYFGIDRQEAIQARKNWEDSQPEMP